MSVLDHSASDIRSFLRGISPFSMLDDSHLDSIIAEFTARRFSIGEIVFHAGDPADAFYIVTSGRARVVGVLPDGRETTLASLTKGQSFGEASLLKDSIRAHTIRAAEALTVLRLDKSDFFGLLQKNERLAHFFENYVADTAVQNFVKLSSAFSPLSPEEIRAIVGHFKPCTFDPGEQIVRQGEQEDTYYLLRSGRVEVRRDGALVQLLQAGDGFGELALLTGMPRNADVSAVEKCSAYRLDRSDFETVVSQYPKVKRAFIHMASGYSARALVDSELSLDAAEGHLAEPTVIGPRRTDTTRRFPVVLQQDAMDCGAACLAIILRWHGKHVGINRLRHSLGGGQSGTTLARIGTVAASLGFQTRAVKTNVESVGETSFPAIAHWHGGHFVVVVGVDSGRFLVADPAVGMRQLDSDAFARCWTGNLLELRPTARLGHDASHHHSGASVLTDLASRGLPLAAGLLVCALAQSMWLAVPIFASLWIDGDRSTMVVIGAGLVLLFQAGLMLLGDKLLVRLSSQLDAGIATSFASHIFRLPVRFFEDRTTSDVAARFEDAAKVRELVNVRALRGVAESGALLSFLIAAFIFSPLLGLVQAVCMVLLYGAARLADKPLTRYAGMMLDNDRHLRSRLRELVSQLSLFKGSAGEHPLSAAILEDVSLRAKSSYVELALGAVASMLVVAVAFTVLWLGVGEMDSRLLTTGQFVASLIVALLIGGTGLRLASLARELSGVRVALQRVADVMELEERESADRTETTARIQGAIAFESVTFRYSSQAERAALKEVSLQIPPGSTVAVIGKTGAGKSTLARLIAGFDVAGSGRVTIDRQDMKSISWLARDQIAYVPQDNCLVRGTIQDNITAWNPSGMADEVVATAMLAGAHEFVEQLPLGYQTVIGDRGRGLSEGEKKRIAVARAIYAKPRVLIVDDAAATLDAEAERKLYESLQAVLPGRTKIFTSSRPSVAQRADIVFVLEEGVLVESGAPESLIEQRGRYWRLLNDQAPRI